METFESARGEGVRCLGEHVHREVGGGRPQPRKRSNAENEGIDRQIQIIRADRGEAEKPRAGNPETTSRGGGALSAMFLERGQFCGRSLSAV